LNNAGTFQAKLPTIFNCPLSPMPCYYVEMPNSLSTTTNNQTIINKLREYKGKRKDPKRFKVHNSPKLTIKSKEI